METAQYVEPAHDDAGPGFESYHDDAGPGYEPSHDDADQGFERPAEEVPADDGLDGLRSMEDWEREAIRRALERNDGHRGRAARELGISERSIYRKIRDYGLDEYA